MEETELEEGEACYYSDTCHDEASLDPDVDLSYIDKKIQDILGHFQKDFEGGVSAENLGAKFGGYGSFLCPWSPSVLSHPKTPQQVQSSSTSRSPISLQSENTTVPPSARVGRIYPSAVQLPVSKASPVEKFSKRDLSLSSASGTGELIPKQEPVNKLIHPPDQKTLKVRIKVGPDSKLSKNNAALYSGLGLDESPSSSVEDSPIQSRGFSLVSQEALGQSSMSILQDVTSFPVPGGCLLSPLSESLLCLMERETPLRGSRTGVACRSSEESSAMSSYESPAKGNDKIFGEQKKKLVAKRSAEVNNKDPGNVVLLKIEMGIETLDETRELAICHNIKSIEKQNPKTSSAGMVWEDKKAGLNGDVHFDPIKDGKDLVGESVDIQKQVSQKATSYEKHGLITPHQRELPPSGGKKKSKGSQRNISMREFSKEKLEIDSPASAKDKKKRTGDHPSRDKPDVKLRKESVKNRERYIELFNQTEETEKRLDLSETHLRDGLKYYKLDIADKQEESSCEKFDKQSTLEAISKAAPDPSLTRRGPVSDVVPATTNTVLINDDWVCCDRCGKWRLLPYGTNAELLQQSQWLCSMLTWLPGMNRCGVSEEDTTRALEAVYYGNQNNLHSHSVGTTSGIPLDDTRHLGQNHWNHSLPAVASGGKKKHKMKEGSNEVSQMGLMHSLNPTKKNQQASLKSRNNVKQSTLKVDLANKANFQHLSKSADIAVARERCVQKGDTKHLKMNGKRGADRDKSKASKKIKTERLDYANEDQNSGNGEIARKVVSSSNDFLDNMILKDVHKHKYSLKESKFDVMDKISVCPKKKKDQVQVSFNGGALDLRNCDKMNISAKKRKVKDWQESQMYPPPVSFPDTGHHLQDNKDLVKDDSIESEFSKGEEIRMSKSVGKESKASKGEGKPGKMHGVTRDLISGCRVPDGMEEKDKGSVVKGQQVGCHEGQKTGSQQTVDGIDLMRRDMGYGQVSVTATSSSSKVSRSHKSKANYQEVKSSPVKSVSSSPMRLSNSNKILSARGKLTGKDDAANAGLSIIGSPKRCSDGEGDGVGDQFGIMKNEKASVIDSAMVDNQQKYANHTSSSKPQGLTGHSSGPESIHLVNGCTNQQLEDKEHGHSERVDKSCNRSNGSLPWKSGNGSSLWCRDKHGSSKSSCDRVNAKISNSFSEQEEMCSTKKTRCEVDFGSHDHSEHLQESVDGKCSYQEKFIVKPIKDGRDYLEKNDSAEKCSNERRKGNRSKSGGHEGSDVKGIASCIKDRNINLQQNLLQDLGGGSLNLSLSDRTDSLEAEQNRGNSKFLPYSGDKQETPLRCPHPNDGAPRGSGSDAFLVDATCSRVEAPKVPKQPSKPDNQNRAQHSSLRHSAANALDAPSSVRKDCSSQIATNPLKEATDLKHKADRLKNTGAELESTGLYFRAALKFLYGASLLEPCNYESAKHGEMTHSMLVYSDTGRLCEFVAHEYERCKEMAAAALAYKCMEVAYLRVIYSKHSCASRDRHELQKALQMVPPGESPSSSASDIDNLNNQATLDKVAAAKGVNSPQVIGNHVIVARNRPSFVRMLNFAQDAIFAMEASRKSHSAFAAANVGREEAQNTEGISSVKRAIDFNFHDIEGLLCLVRHAMEAIGH